MHFLSSEETSTLEAEFAVHLTQNPKYFTQESV